MAKPRPEEVVDDSPESSSTENTKKRKRKPTVSSGEELEIDVNLPEPPSKKAKREAAKKEKREKKSESDKLDSTTTPARTETTDSNTTTKRSDHGIWIGNLPWTATKDSLRTFLRERGSIAETDIVRIHMPPPVQDKHDRRPDKPQNKGFAYVDFSTKAVLEAALELTEQLLGGRKVLIKNAKSFEGRPDKPKGEGGQAVVKGNAKSPAKRVFVGNLDFAITQEDLREHFGQAGEVEDVFLATFEDSGKCKGYGWIRFAELEAAEAAVRGFVFKKQVGEDEDDDDENGKKDGEESKGGENKKNKAKKPRKWFINRLHGRELRCEFAEDSAVRYNKRFGKRDQQQSNDGLDTARPQRGSFQQREKRDRPARKVDTRNIAPAKALANAPRGSSAIVAGAGKKLTFDE